MKKKQNRKRVMLFIKKEKDNVYSHTLEWKIDLNIQS